MPHLPFILSTMISYNDPTSEMLHDYLELKQERLASIEEKLAPFKAKIDEQNKIIADELAKVPAQAWKRKNVADVPKKESQVSIDAKELLVDLMAKSTKLESDADKLKTAIDELLTTIDENEEFCAWSENLKLPRKQRQDLPVPARIKRMVQREVEEREESIARGEWLALTLDHNSQKGKEARTKFYKQMDSQGEFDVVIDKQVETPKVEEVVIEVAGDTYVQPKQKLPWWYKKYNISLEA